jgi:hypothetical protein
MNAFAAVIYPGALETVAVLLIGLVTTVVPILVVFWFARKMIENKRENTRLRLEVSKLAHELEQYRRQNPQAGAGGVGQSP